MRMRIKKRKRKRKEEEEVIEGLEIYSKKRGREKEK